MRFLILLVIAIMGTATSPAQSNFGNEWVTGFGYKFDFSTSPPTHDTFFLNNGTLAFGAGASCLSDSSGHIVLQCDGADLVDRNGVPVDNGDSLIPNLYYDKLQGWSRSPQSSLILPVEQRKYYVLTPTVSDAYYQNVWLNKPALNWNFDLLLYHVVDLYANAGLGKVVQKKVPLLQNTPMKKSQMAACRHANGKDWWLLKMAGDTNMVFTFLVQQDTILRYPNQYIPFPLRGVNDVWGQMKFSRDGTRWATTYEASNDTTYQHFGDVYTAGFDRCTGLLSGFQQFIAPPYIDTGNIGLEFSPNGKFLYVTKYNAVQQLDLTDGTWYTVHGPDTNAFCGYTTLELAPDNKIYIGRFHGICKQWSVINSPDVKFNCDFCPNCLRSKSVNGYFFTPPNMPNYELGATGQPCWPLEVAAYSEKGEDGFQIFPNPFNRELTLELRDNSKEGGTFKLYDVSGLELFHQAIDAKARRIRIQLPVLNPGVYLYRIEGLQGNAHFYGKLIKE